jgi:hypothetical protein
MGEIFEVANGSLDAFQCGRMTTWRIGAAVLLASLAADAVADGRSASFNVSVRVIATLRSRAQAAVPPASFVITADRATLPCGAPSSAACRAAVVSASTASGGPVSLTSFTDGTPPGVVEH